jgi:fatty-acyl-CoA synthase
MGGPDVITAQQIAARANDDTIGLLFDDERVTWREVVQRMCDRAAWLEANWKPGPRHIGVLLENTPEFHYWLGALALTGGTLVGINPTRRGAELARDIEHTDCQLIVTTAAQRHTIDELRLPISLVEVGEIETSWIPTGAELPAIDHLDATTNVLLLFTSGTTGAPKAVRCTQGRLGGIGERGNLLFQLKPGEVAYCSMPLFHSNALMACWSPAVAVGATLALRRSFSASAFIDDVRRYGASYANYVGKPMAYILATPERADDAENPLRLMFGNEAGHGDIDTFAARFNCMVVDGYGSTEGGVGLTRFAGMPSGALGIANETVVVLDSETGAEKPRAVFNDAGRLLNAEASTGEICALDTASSFEGYYRNEEATAHKTRDGIYWSGDLGYKDDKGFVYFAGRDVEWLRVDGENFAAAPVERLVARYPGIVLAAVYGVPNAIAGDDVMVAIQVNDPAAFDVHAFALFLTEQPDLGTKWMPRYVRITATLPVTHTNKVLKRELRVERWDRTGTDIVFWRAGRSNEFAVLDATGSQTIEQDFVAKDRLNFLAR